MSLKSAALFALVGMILLTVVLALGLIREISAFTSGAIAANAMLVLLIHLLASLSVSVFLYVFYRAQSSRWRYDKSGIPVENPATIPRQAPLRSEHKP